MDWARVRAAHARAQYARAHPIFVNVRGLALEEAREPLGRGCGGPLVLKVPPQPLPLLGIIPSPLSVLLLGGELRAPLQLLRDPLLQLGRGEQLRRSRHESNGL